jgi:hypothetical protein
MNGAQSLVETPVEAVAKQMCSGKKTAMLLRGRALIGDGLAAAGRIHAKTGVRLLCDTFAPQTEIELDADRERTRGRSQPRHHGRSLRRAI